MLVNFNKPSWYASDSLSVCILLDTQAHCDVLCSRVRSDVGYPLKPLLQGHSWWHVLSATGTYLSIIFWWVTAVSSIYSIKRMHFVWLVCAVSIGLVRFQAGSCTCTRQPRLASVFHIILCCSNFRLVDALCFCCVRITFFNTARSNQLWKMLLEWPVVCWGSRKTLTLCVFVAVLLLPESALPF